MLISTVTINQVLLLSSIRFRRVVYAISSRGEMNTKTCTHFVKGIWLVSCVVAIPFIFTFDVRQGSSGRSACTMREDIDIILYICGLSLTIGYLIPMLLVTVLCISIVIFLMSRKTSVSSRPSRRREKQVYHQLAIVVIGSLIGYGVVFIVSIYIFAKVDEMTGRAIWTMVIIAHAARRVCECVNPFLFYMGSSEIRDTVKQMWNNQRSPAVRAVAKKNATIVTSSSWVRSTSGG